MSARQQLSLYLDRLEKRLRTGAALRGAALLTSVALVATVVLVLIANFFAFSGGSIISARIVLIMALAAAAALGIAWPLRSLNSRRTARKAENVFPEFNQRLLTFAERDGDHKDPFMELLAADTLQVARAAEPAQLVSDVQLFTALTAGVASLAVLVWIIAAGPGFLGAGASLLWTGSHDTEAPFYDLKVSPGDVAIRRNTDQMITAQLVGLQTQQVRLFARSHSASAWEQVSMEPQSAGSGFQFVFSAVPEDLEYYVEAGALRSKHFNIRVVDLPAVKQIKVTYHFPTWTGLPIAVEDPGGDLRAVQGTAADLEITMDRPLRDGLLVLDDDKQLQLAPGSQGNVYKTTVQLDKDGLYHVAALDQGQQVRLSGDYFIEARQAQAPEVTIGRPARDYRSSPVEEVTVTVAADAEFGLNDMSLHYSVNGAPEKVVSLLKQKGVRQADGSTTLYLEDYKLVPGDVVSFYATAKDARTESQTDMFFIQADPFEREFSQSQAAGGGGGGGGGGMDQQEEISKREKDIIAATWTQQRGKNPNKQQAQEAAQFLSDMQNKLRDQAESLAGRLERRELTEQNQEFSDFQKSMEAAAGAMAPAVDSLKQLKWADALPHEQQALQHLLRAEATFRQISVAFGNRGGGGGGGGGGAGRDLSSLFDLELDTEKNQYETEQSANSANKQNEQIDEALQKLEQLARRQQELADQRNSSQQTPEQRWQQEMLRREAEQLQRQMEQMARNSQQGQQGQQQGQQQGGQQSSGQQSGSQSGQSASGGSQGGDSRMKQALDRVRQANDDMRRAASQPQSEADARRAADRLKEATDLLGGEKQQQASGQLDSLAREADRLAAQQRAQANRMADMFGQPPGPDGTPGRPRAQAGGPSAQEQRQFAQERQQAARDLARLQDQTRQAMRSLASSQRDASTKLREALAGVEDSDLQNLLERSSNWINQGAGPFASTIEPRISEGFTRLDDQIRQAQSALGNQPGQGQGREQALDRLQRLRDNLEAIDRNMADRNGQRGQGQPGQPGQQGQQGPGQQRGQQGAQGQQGGQGQQNGQGQQGGQGQQAGMGQQGGGQQGGNYGGGNRVGGNANGGLNGGWWGGRDYYGGMDTGGQVFPQGDPRRQAQPLSQAEMERLYQDAMQQLNNLRQSYRDQPDTLGDIQALVRQMQSIDPSRFPGNPALVEQLHTQVLAGIDRLELQVRRQAEDQQGGQIRSGDSATVPSGYGNAWAEYTRRLSKEK